MKNKTIVVRSFTLITAVLSFLFFQRLRQNNRNSQSVPAFNKHNEPHRIAFASEKILLESAEFPLAEIATDDSSTMDDLKKIHGIGSKSEAALNNAGVMTYQDLSHLSRHEIETILTRAGVRVVNCEGWQEAARTLIN